MLPVSVEESKAQRIQRQQARLRDRGGAFVPSEKNPLIDILLSRTVSGESPSKLHTRSRSRSISPSKAQRNTAASKHQESPLKDLGSTINTNAQAGSPKGNAVVGSSTKSGGKSTKAERKKKSGPTRKGKGNTKPNDDEAPEGGTSKAEPAPKRKGRPPKTKARATDLDINADPEPPMRKAKTSTVKPPGNSKLRSKLTEAPQSDDDITLVEAPRLKTRSKRKPVIVTIHSDDDEDESTIANQTVLPKSVHKRPSVRAAPLHRAQAKQRTEAHKHQSGEVAELTTSIEASQTRKQLKREDVNEVFSNPVKSETYGSITIEIPMKKPATGSKRSTLQVEGEDAEQPTKKAKILKSQSVRSLPPSNSPAISKSDVETSAIKQPNTTMKKDTKRKKECLPESDNEDYLPKKPALKRTRFVEELKPFPQISSVKQKENIVSRKAKAGKPTSRSKSRGPPQEVLERIKACATLRRVDDSAPDPLDCLS